MRSDGGTAQRRLVARFIFHHLLTDVQKVAPKYMEVCSAYVRGEGIGQISFVLTEAWSRSMAGPKLKVVRSADRSA